MSPLPAFLLSSPPSARRRRSRTPLIASHPPPPHRNHHKHSHRVRIERKYTSQSPDWQWRGSSRQPQSPVSWRDFFNVEDSVLKVFESLWSQSRRVSESNLLARMTALGARVLKKFTEVIERTLNPPTPEMEIMIEYGVTEPNPADKTFVDPLREWDVSNVTYYRDSFGRPVYLQLHGAAGLATATEFYDLHDDPDHLDDEESMASESSSSQPLQPPPQPPQPSNHPPTAGSNS